MHDLPKLGAAESDGAWGIFPICSYWAKLMAATSRLNNLVNCSILFESHSTSTRISYSEPRRADFLDSMWITFTPRSFVSNVSLFISNVCILLYFSSRYNFSKLYKDDFLPWFNFHFFLKSIHTRRWFYEERIIRDYCCVTFTFRRMSG